MGGVAVQAEVSLADGGDLTRPHGVARPLGAVLVERPSQEPHSRPRTGQMTKNPSPHD